MVVPARRPALAGLVASLVALPVAACGGGPTPGAAPPPAAVWVAEEGADSLTVIDAATGTVTARLTGIREPHNVQAAGDGGLVWAVSADDQVVALDGTDLEVTAVGATDSHPAHVVSDDAGRVYVSSGGQPSVYAYDERLRPVSRTALAGAPHGLRLSADGRTAVVANTGSGTVDVLDTATGALVSSIPVGQGPVQVAVADDGSTAYVSVAGPEEVVRVDLAAGAVTHRVRVPSAPAQILLTPSGLLLSADQGTEAAPGRTVSVIDTVTMSVEAQVRVGSGPHGLTTDPAGHRAWVTNVFDDTVTEIDLRRRAAVRTIAVGARPGGISFSPATPVRRGDVALDLPSREDRGDAHDHGH